MAAYIDLYTLQSNDLLRNKVAAAAVIKAQNLIDGSSPTVDQLTWSIGVLRNPLDKGQELLRYVLAANKGLSVTQITGAGDSVIQANVDTAADALILGGVV